MELAIIPPIAHLDEARRFKYQLALPHMFIQSKDYAKYFLGLSETDHHIILDNGAAEKESVDFHTLFNIGRLIRAKEIALPDHLGKGHATMLEAKQWLKYLYENGLYGDAVPFKYGFVLQGADQMDALSSLELLMETAWKYAHLLGVVYIPRLHIRRDNPNIRIQLAKAVKRRYPHLDVHLFGASQNYLGDIPTGSTYPFIRSVDTSAPYTFAMRGRHIDRGWYLTPITRPKDYFSINMNGHYLGRIASQNVKTMEAWCHEQKASVS